MVEKKKPRKDAKRASRASPPRHTPTKGLYGWITHTEFVSADPAATTAWCAKVLGWVFKPSLATPAGEYHLFAYSDQGGGGIRHGNAGEAPGSLPFVHVASVEASFEKALREGAQALSAPQKVIEGVAIAIVKAPGGVAIGLSGPS